MAGVFDHLHLKRHTAGSSNELSFDVLDAASNEASGKARRSQKAPKGPRASQGTYHGVAGSATFSSNAEVARRKKARRSHSVRLWAVLAVVVAVLVGVGIWAATRVYEQNATLNERFNDLVDSFADIDALLVDIDDLMQDLLSEGSAEAQQAAVGAIPQARTQARAISTSAEELGQYMPSGGDSVALDQVQQAAEARVLMLQAAESAFSLASEARTQLAASVAVWSQVLAADQLAREAALQANAATTQQDTLAAQQSTREALEQFQSARDALQGIQAAHPAIDLGLQLQYLEKKIESLGYAVQTADALLQGDRVSAVWYNDEYNEADEQAAQLAESLPPSLGDAVSAGFLAELQPVLDDYETARNQAVSADSTIRDYLSH